VAGDHDDPLLVGAGSSAAYARVQVNSRGISSAKRIAIVGVILIFVALPDSEQQP
jgi:hypothetical protein